MTYLRQCSVAALLFATLCACDGPADGPAALAAPATPPAMDAPGPLDAAFVGRVTERLPAGSYCYLQIKAADGRHHWVATVGDGQPVGTPVRVKSMGVRNDFHSKRLSRTFDRLLFAIVHANGVKADGVQVAGEDQSG